MKRLSKIIVSALCLTLLFSLAGCNKYKSVQKVFEDAGYTHSETFSSLFSDLSKYFEEKDIVVTPHYFTKGVAGLEGSVLVLEFKSNDDIDAAIEGSEMLKGYLKDLQKSDYVNKNCVCIPIVCVDPTQEKVLEIFQSA